jgi:hypothetical protein
VSGVVQDARGLGAHDHACWAFDNPAQFESRAREFLTEGLAGGYRVWLVTPQEPLGVREWPGFALALDSGAARVLAVNEHYADGVVDPVAQVAAYAAATDEALAAGYTGLRVAADATSLVRTPAALDEFARYEHLIDRYMLSRPFSALCAYDRAALGGDVVEQVAAMHPVANAGASLFRLYAGSGAGTAATVAGELGTRERAARRPSCARRRRAPRGSSTC